MLFEAYSADSTRDKRAPNFSTPDIGYQYNHPFVLTELPISQVIGKMNDKSIIGS